MDSPSASCSLEQVVQKYSAFGLSSNSRGRLFNLKVTHEAAVHASPVLGSYRILQTTLPTRNVAFTSGCPEPCDLQHWRPSKLKWM